MKTFSDITYDDIQKFLEAKITIGGTCPACGINSWITEAKGDDMIYLPTGLSNDFQLMRQRFPVFSMSCANCGYVSLHMMAAVLRWLNEAEPELPGT